MCHGPHPVHLLSTAGDGGPEGVDEKFLDGKGLMMKV